MARGHPRRGTKGNVTVGIQFVTNAGLAKIETQDVELVDAAELNKPAPGKISRGRSSSRAAAEGSRCLPLRREGEREGQETLEGRWDVPFPGSAAGEVLPLHAKRVREYSGEGGAGSEAGRDHERLTGVTSEVSPVPFSGGWRKPDLLCHRQPDGELRAAARFALYVDGAAMRCDDLPRDGQSQPVPVGLCGVKWAKEFGQLIERDAATRVDHVEADGAVIALGGERERASVGHGLFGVEHQVQETLFEEVAVDVHRRDVRRGEPLDLDVVLPRGGSQEIEQPRDDRIELGRCGGQIPHPRESQEIGSEIDEFLALAGEPRRRGRARAARAATRGSRSLRPGVAD